jgi:acyl-CoA synthetase (AMP-forming)/AMP-acid ligase II
VRTGRGFSDPSSVANRRSLRFPDKEALRCMVRSRRSGRGLGQAIKAFIVPQDGERPDAAALLVWCADKMPCNMVPKTITILTDLPKTPTGKVDYQALRQRDELA